MLRLAWPLVAERLSLSLLAAVNGMLVGRYVGDDGLAAVGLAVLILWMPETGIAKHIPERGRRLRCVPKWRLHQLNAIIRELGSGSKILDGSNETKTVRIQPGRDPAQNYDMAETATKFPGQQNGGHNFRKRLRQP